MLLRASIAIVLFWLAADAAAQEDVTPPQADQASPSSEATPSAPVVEESTDARVTPPGTHVPDPRAERFFGGWEFEGWVWLGDLLNDQNGSTNYWDAVVALAVTKTFDQRLTLSAQGNFIGANGNFRAELEQGFASALLNEDSQTILTVGKVNANFGVEPRDFWNRRTATTSLLFGAQPQDLVGAIVTQPIGDSGVKLRPFITADFQGAFVFDQSPTGGLMVEYSPDNKLSMAVTGLVGPGFLLFGGQPLHEPFPKGDYGTDAAAVALNWQGPNLYAESGGTLYFLEFKIQWQPRDDLTLQAEYLIGTSTGSSGTFGWQGWMALADFDITDRWHVYSMYSYLDDSDWLITGFFQTRQEVSIGAGFRPFDGWEIRAEYRHDWSDTTPDANMVSIDLTFRF